jgi:hypothetical protein
MNDDVPVKSSFGAPMAGSVTMTVVTITESLVP